MRRNTVDNLLGIFLTRTVLVIGLIALSINSIPQASASTPSVESGFPDDFVTLYTQKHGSFKDTGGKGEEQIIGGFGGLKDKTRAENQSALARIPIILLHGNGVHALQSEEIRLGFIPIPTLGVWPIRDFLVDELGYNDAEIWAISYLGSNPPPDEMELGPVVQNNLMDVRRFIDTVLEYLGVEKVDIIAHSLGNNMAKGYMIGFRPDNNTWDNSDHRLDKIGTYISVAGAHYGVSLLPSYIPMPPGSDADKGSVFEKGAHEFNGITDDTPYGALTSDQISDNPNWVKQTPLDEEAASGGHDKITYVAIRSKDDFVDDKADDSSRLVGAHLNHEFDLTDHGKIDMINIEEHGRIITEQEVFDLYKVCLNGGDCRPVAPPNGPWTSTNGEHKSAGRAYVKYFMLYYAKGSDDYLGFSGQITTLRETSPGYYAAAN